MNTRSFRKFFILAASVWTLLIIGLFIFDTIEQWRFVRNIALTEAKAAMTRDLVYRLWNAEHGGVYVPVTEKTPPNPYLSHIPDRDITLPSGKKLTLVNPAYMSKQVYSMKASGKEVFGHLTSIKPLNPLNAPDAWEAQMLEGFAMGMAEASTLATLGGSRYLRYMRPLTAEKTCIGCHGIQGYEEGEVRGGISVSVPFAPYYEGFLRQARNEFMIYAVICLSGIGLIRFGYRQVTARTLSLRESEERFRMIFDNATEGILLAEVETRKFFMANAKICDMLGYTREELLAIGVDEIHPPQYLPLVLDQFDRQARGDFTMAREIPVLRKNGEIFHADINSRRIHLFGRDCLLGFFRDISERIQAEEALLESEQRYEIFLKNFQGIAYEMHNRTFEPVFFHGTVEQITGYTPFDFLSGLVTWDRIVHPEDLHVLLREGGKIASVRDYTADCEYRIIRRDGEVRWVNDICRASLDRNNPELIQGAVHDITQRKMAEEALRASEARYRIFFEDNPHPMWVYDEKDLSFLAVNKTAIRHYGYSEEEFLSMTIKEIRPPEDVPAILEYLSHTSDKIFRSDVWRHRKKDGTIIHAEVSTHAIDFAGKKARLLLSHDITERIQAEQERAVLEDQLRQSQKIEAVGLLAGGVAHDFNNILSVIMGYASLLQMKLKKDDPLTHNVEGILSATERAASLTQSLLAFSRKQVIEARPVNLNDIVENAEKLLCRVIGEDIEVRIEYAPEALVVMADFHQLDQVLINLAANARDAMPGGGTLTIQTARVEIDENFMREKGFGEKGRYALISVSDTGTGMNEATRQRIFEPFFTTKELGRGTGLGLSIVYGIVSQNHGYIACESGPSKGTAFHIYLPLVRAAAEAVIRPESVLPSGGKETILIAEDDESVRKLSQSVFEEFGYTVVPAGDGDDAIRKFSENPDAVQLVILDVIMPKKNGKEVLDEIRKIRPDIKALFMSGYTADIISNKGIIQEEVHFMTKPYSPLELLSRVRDLLDS